jgi:hypothetical protein
MAAVVEVGAVLENPVAGIDENSRQRKHSGGGDEFVEDRAKATVFQEIRSVVYEKQ